MLDGLAQLIVRKKTPVIVAYMVLLPILATFSIGVLQMLKPGGFRDPSAESTLVHEAVRDFIAGDIVVLYRATDGTVDEVEAWDAIVPALVRTEQDPGVLRVVSFFSTGAPTLISSDRSEAVVLVMLRGNDNEKVATARRVRALLEPDGTAATVRLGGYAPVFDGVTATVQSDLRRAELIALPLTALLLLLLFRSVVSALLPVLLGGIAVTLSLSALRLLDMFMEVTVFAANVATVLGLGLAIDYALFLLTRFREELPAHGTAMAIRIAMRTTGRAVLFSGVTVAVSLCGLFVFPQGMLRSIAVGGIAVTLATVVLALTLLPALLAWLGPRVDALQLPFGLPLPAENDDGQTGGWVGVARTVMRYPILIGGTVVALLVVCALPFARLAPSVADARALNRGTEARDVWDDIEAHFDAHQTTPIDIVISWPKGPLSADRIAAVAELVQRVRALPHVARVDSPLSLSGGNAARATTLLLADDPATRPLRELFVRDPNAAHAGVAARLAVVVSLDVADAAALSLVQQVRDLAPPTGAEMIVGGQSAWIVDVRASLHKHTPWMVAFIALAMGVVLFMVFGSVVLPIKALLMNVLSLTASFGAIVFVFQDGRLQDLLHFEATGTTEAAVPVLMFAIVFGLSMDYEVLLLSRVREELLLTGDNTTAVARGLQRTGRLITSAALLLVIVVAAFGTSSLVLIKTLSLGIALAVLLDATVVRTLLVPATMRLLGDWNWWSPAWLRRLWEKSRLGH